ncbi:MAG: ABC transporter ATP-binding protein [Desulfobacteraceae bacterium]|jgi:branched-chain amino acid transport system ATP-binding protein|nr:ABC transporter ATP-binding protein [Desulfobacteraceae bacterium]
MMLKTDKATIAFGGLLAVNKVDFQLEEGMLASIIGPNGAGKTTFFNLLSGYYPPTEGRVFYAGEDITELAPYERVMKGMGRTFQITNIFPELSVFDNIMIAAQRLNVPFEMSKLKTFMFLGKDKKSEEVAHSVLEEIGLAGEADTMAGTLSHGLKQRLEIGMALTLNPKVLLFDETFAGLSVGETKQQIEYVRKISSKYTILIVEHKMDVVMDLSERVSVMHQGELIAEGTPEEVRADDFVQKVYLREVV